MARWVALVAAAFSANCATIAHRDRAEAETVAVIRAELHRICSGDSCELGDCWSEAQDLVVCRVELSVASGWSGADLLAQLHTDLQMQHAIDAGFCAHSSVGSKIAVALIVVMVVVVLEVLARGHGLASGSGNFQPYFGSVNSSSESDYLAVGLGSSQGEGICRRDIVFSDGL